MARRQLRWMCTIAAAVLSAHAAAASVRSHALYARGLVPFNNGQWEAAYRLFNEAVATDSRDPWPLYYRGLTQARRGAAAAAIQDMEAALAIDPALPRAPLDLGIAYFNTGQYPAARNWLQRAYQQGVDRFSAAYFLGLTEYRLHDDGAAAEHLSEATADPDLRPTAEYYAGLALLRQGKSEAGRAQLTQAGRDQPTSEVGREAQRYTGSGEVRQPPAPVEREFKKPWSLTVEGSILYDSNVVVAPSDSDVKAAEGISRQSDGAVAVTAAGAYTLLDSDVATVRGEYDFSQDVHFKLTRFDLQGHRVRIDTASRPGPVSYGLSMVYDLYLLDYQSFFQEPLLTPWLAVAEGDSAATQVYYTFRYRDFFRPPFNPSRDGFNHALGVRQFVLLGARERVLSAGYQYDAEHTQKSSAGAHDFAYTGHQLDVNVSLPLYTRTQALLGYAFRLEDYRFPNSATGFVFRRHDHEHAFAAEVAHALSDNLALTLDYVGVINASNIAPFDYDRNLVSVGVRVAF